MRTFNEVSTAARRRIGGDVAVEATSWRMARSTSAGPFRRHAHGQPACCSAGFLRTEIKHDPQSTCSWRRRRDRPAGTSEHTDQASDLLRRERERVSVVVRIGVAICEERASGVGRRRQRRAITMCVSDVRKKGDPGWQSKETSPKTRDTSNWVASRGDTSYKHASLVRNYR
jgi:hypothetical protein